MNYQIAIILPTTLKIAGYEDLRSLSLSLKKTKNLNYGLFMAVDEDDNYDEDRLRSIFENAQEIVVKKYPIAKPLRICSMWRDLAKKAYERGYDFFLLLGDDVEISENWYEEAIKLFREISEKNNVPFGVGCVCIKDTTSPNFPTFPIVHRKHIELFDEIFPEVFVNQDADPYLYELYRRVNCTEWTKDSSLINKRGGVTHGLNRVNSPVYEPIHVEWRDNILQSALEKLKDKYNNLTDVITIDVVIPSFRVDGFYLGSIVSIEKDERVNHRFVVVVDKNIRDITKEQLEYLKNLERNSPTRVRINEKNMGASFSRNRGMQESHSDWILYLDDDVLADKKIIQAYADAIIDNPEKDGFVGKSVLPHDGRNSTTAVHMAQTSFFWTICNHFTEVPWGVTANLLVKRYKDVEFDLDFPKAGGGEDIDFCLKIKKWPLVAVPDAVVTHPWWNNGQRFPMWKRFVRWANGDGLLINKYPQHTFRTLPNVWEWTIILSSSSVILGRSSLQFIPVLWTAEFASGTLWVYYHWDNCPYLNGSKRLLVALESNFPRNASELGHTLHNVSHGKFENITKRFDWFCDLYPEGISYEKNRSYFHNAGFLSGFLLFIFLFRIMT